MARAILTLIGFALLALGVWLAIIWWSILLIALKATAIIVAILLGLLLLVFGISEMTGARKPPQA